MSGIHRNSRAYKLLKYLAVGAGTLLISIIAPSGGAQLLRAGIAGYFRKKKFEKSHFLRDLRNLQVRQLINYRDLGNDRIEITLTKKGKNKVLFYQLDEMRLKKPSRWDGKWRLIIFDIPHSHRRARDAFRQKLRNLKFYHLQKSVFITPYSCEDEIDFITSIFDIRKYILILYIANFEGQEKLKHHFGL